MRRLGLAKGGSLENAVVIRDDIAYQMITVPLRAPVTIGWVSIGFRIDGALADRLASLTGLTVNLLAADGDSPVVLASSMGDSTNNIAAGSILQPKQAALVIDRIDERPS